MLFPAFLALVELVDHSVGQVSQHCSPFDCTKTPMTERMEGGFLSLFKLGGTWRVFWYTGLHRDGSDIVTTSTYVVGSRVHCSYAGSETKQGGDVRLTPGVLAGRETAPLPWTRPKQCTRIVSRSILAGVGMNLPQDSPRAVSPYAPTNNDHERQ